MTPPQPMTNRSSKQSMAIQIIGIFANLEALILGSQPMHRAYKRAPMETPDLLLAGREALPDTPIAHLWGAISSPTSRRLHSRRPAHTRHPSWSA